MYDATYCLYCAYAKQDKAYTPCLILCPNFPELHYDRNELGPPLLSPHHTTKYQFDDAASAFILWCISSRTPSICSCTNWLRLVDCNETFVFTFE